MMEVLKRRLALYLAVLMFVPAIVGAFPGAAQEVQAAKSYTMYWRSGGETKTTFKVEAGQKFYIGDLVWAYDASSGGPGKTGSLLKMTYTSSKRSVAAVDKSTGLVTAKASGKTTISAKYGKKTMKCTLQVVKKGSLKSTTTYKSLNNAANALAKEIPTEVTAKKAVKAIKALKTYENTLDKKGIWADSYCGFSEKDYPATQELVVPMAGRYMTLDSMLNNLAWDNNPTDTSSSHLFKISKVSASVSKNTITVTLKAKATEKQIIALQYDGSYNKKLKNTTANKAQFMLRVTEQKTGKRYYAIADASAGSKTLTLKLYDMTYKNGKESWKRVSLVKGRKYQLGFKYDWAKGKTVTAK